MKSSLAATVSYLLLTLAMTWPLAPGIARDVPGDLGDSLLNMWILAWGAEQVPRLLAGRIALHDYWNANIFHPEPLTLAFSEHLFGQVLQILPVYHLTGNIILGYNLLFLSSFVLSGLGMFLLVRELLGDARREVCLAAAFIAGLIYAFYPFRIAQVAHLQSLSSQWMPLALYGFVRFARSGERRPLVGATAALLLQNWSCGYYLIFFAPFVPLFVVHQLWLTGRLREPRVWAALLVAAAVVTGGTWPFLALYLEAKHVHGLTRPLGEVMSFSADVHSYFSAAGALRLWGPLVQSWPKAEGELFFGFTPLLLAGAGVAALFRSQPSVTTESAPQSRLRRTLLAMLRFVIGVQIATVLFIVFTGGFVTSFAGLPLRATNATRILINVLILSAMFVALSTDTKRPVQQWLRSPVGWAALLAVLALWMSLGPLPHTRGQLLQVPALYAVFYEHVPGFAGLRVPARYAMVVAVFLSIVAGAGVAALLRRVRWPRALATLLASAFVAEAAFLPMSLNHSWGGDFVTPPSRVQTAASAPAIYHRLAALPAGSVVAEFPFGDISWELRYVYYSTVHWKRVLNGYSGAFPPSYKTRVALFERVADQPEAAWDALRAAGTTHVVVHRSAMSPVASAAVEAWLLGNTAAEIARSGDDLLFELPIYFADASRPPALSVH